MSIELLLARPSDVENRGVVCVRARADIHDRVRSHTMSYNMFEEDRISVSFKLLPLGVNTAVGRCSFLRAALLALHGRLLLFGQLVASSSVSLRASGFCSVA